VQGQFGQVVAIVFQGAFTTAGQGDFLVELLVKFAESRYISAGSVNGVCFFFMVMVLNSPSNLSPKGKYLTLPFFKLPKV
jgi:hypothetical protein